MIMRRVLVFCVLACLALAAHAEFRAGIAVRNVTPDPLLPVSGGIGPSQKTTRKLGELTVRALVFEQDAERVAVVSGDFLGFPGVLCDQVRAQVEGIPPENILIGATHTHSAPDCYGFPGDDGQLSIDVNYVHEVVSKMGEAVREAIERLEPAYLKINTDVARGKIAYNAYAEKLYDPRCSVIQAVRPSGEAVATLVNYAIHPEVLGADQGITSPDLIGPLCNRIQEKGGGVALFMNSAQGGMVTADCRGPNGHDIQTWEECVRIGYLLADEALRIVAEAPVQKDPELACFAADISFPVESPTIQAVVKASPLNYELRENQIATQLNLVNIGNAQILTIPGEALPNIGYYLKRKMRGDHNLLFGLTNDAFGYILVKEDWNSFERYNYITGTCLGEMTGEILIEEALDLTAACPPPSAAVESMAVAAP
jgi:hypothetical protein